MKRICSEKLVELYGERFKVLYIEDHLPVEKIAPLLGLSNWHSFQLKRILCLEQEQWQRKGMPKTFSDKSMEVLYGTLLGDGSLVLSGNNKYRSLSISHSPKQKLYIEHLRENLRELSPTNVSMNSDKWGTLRFTTPPHPQFSEIYFDLYPNGKKNCKSKNS